MGCEEAAVRSCYFILLLCVLQVVDPTQGSANCKGAQYETGPHYEYNSTSFLTLRGCLPALPSFHQMPIINS